MTGAERAEMVRGLLATGMSRRAIAARLGVSEKTIRTDILRGDVASAPAAYPDYIPPGEGRIIPEPTREQRLFEGGVSHPRKAWIRCDCGAPAFRDAPGIDSWTCSAVVGPRGPHPPRQVLDASGAPQLAWALYRIRPFPGLPSDPG